MKRKGIYAQNSKKLTIDKDTKARIFEYLLKNKGQGVTQSQLTEILGISQSTASRKLNELVGEKRTYRKKDYIVICEGGEYKLVHPEDIVLEIASKTTQQKKQENEAAQLSNPKIWNSDFAISINTPVIFFGINGRYRSCVKTSLMRLFHKHIKDIAFCEKGIYIIGGKKVLFE